MKHWGQQKEGHKDQAPKVMDTDTDIIILAGFLAEWQCELAGLGYVRLGKGAALALARLIGVFHVFYVVLIIVVGLVFNGCLRIFLIGVSPLIERFVR